MERANEFTDDAVDFAAHLAHETNRAYAASIGDPPKPSWADASEHVKKSARDGVRFVWSNPTLTPEDSHNNWLKFKEADGWHYGPVIDEVRKTHPCFLPYKELPEDQKRKDYIFRSTVLGALAFLQRSSAS